MNAPTKVSRLGPSLSEAYPPYGQKIAEAERLSVVDRRAGHKAYLEAQAIGKAWQAGTQYRATETKQYLIALCEDGTIGPITLQRALEDLGLKEA